MLLLPIVTNADDSGSCGESLTYTFVEATKTLTISGSGAMNDYSSYSGKYDSPWWTGNYYKSIQTVVIENGVTSIGKSAFSGCLNLTSVTIPSSVTDIGSSAFSKTGLTSINIPFSVTRIREDTFIYCYNLSSVAIPNSVKSIGSGAFRHCSNLTSINIPIGVTSIEGRTFDGCTSLTSVTIPNNVTTIYDDAFNNCPSLTSVIIGKSVNSFKSSVFVGCNNLTDFYCLAEQVPNIDSGSYSSNTFYKFNRENATLHVPAGSIDAYKNDNNWNKFKEIVALVLPKCAKPTISLKSGKIIFECETEGVEFMPQFTPLNESSYSNGEIMLPNKYRITVYATKEGYEYSDVATLDVEIPVGTKGDVNQDGEVNVADHVKLSDIIMSNETK